LVNGTEEMSLAHTKEKLDEKLGNDKYLYWEKLVLFLNCKISKKEWDLMTKVNFTPDIIYEHNKFIKELIITSRSGYSNEKYFQIF
jgi:hypothetical protein